MNLSRTERVSRAMQKIGGDFTWQHYLDNDTTWASGHQDYVIPSGITCGLVIVMGTGNLDWTLKSHTGQPDSQAVIPVDESELPGHVKKITYATTSASQILLLGWYDTDISSDDDSPNFQPPA